MLTVMLAACAASETEEAPVATPTPETTNGQDDQNDQDDQDDQDTPPDDVEDGERAMEGNMYLEGLPLVRERETFSLMVMEQFDPTDIDNFNMVALLEEQTNVHVDWIIMPFDIMTERQALMLATGDLPDVMAGWTVTSATVVEFGMVEGMFLPLQDYFARLAPNVMEALELPGVRAAMTLPDGNIYSPPYLIPEPQWFNGLWAYQPWLDELGLDLPTNTDELFDAMVAIRDEFPNSIPLAMAHHEVWQVFGLFGYPAVNDGLIPVMVNDVPTFTAATEGYKYGIQWLRRAWDEGLLDPELFTQDINQWRAVGRESPARYGFALMHDAGILGAGIDSDEGAFDQRLIDYVPIHPGTTWSGDPMMWRRGSPGVSMFRNQLVITENATNVPTIIRWIDNLYEPVNSMQSWFGTLGNRTYEISPGVFGNLSEEEQEANDPMPGSEFPMPMPRFVRSWHWDDFQLDEAGLKTRSVRANADALWANNMVEMTPPFWLTPEESDATSHLVTDISAFMRQKRAEWITGVSNIEDEWEDYLAQLDALGLQTWMEVVTEAIDRAR